MAAVIGCYSQVISWTTLLLVFLLIKDFHSPWNVKCDWNSKLKVFFRCIILRWQNSPLYFIREWVGVWCFFVHVSNKIGQGVSEWCVTNPIYVFVLIFLDDGKQCNLKRAVFWPFCRSFYGRTTFNIYITRVTIWAFHVCAACVYPSNGNELYHF